MKRNEVTRSEGVNQPSNESEFRVLSHTIDTCLDIDSSMPISSISCSSTNKRFIVASEKRIFHTYPLPSPLSQQRNFLPIPCVVSHDRKLRNEKQSINEYVIGRNVSDVGERFAKPSSALKGRNDSKMLISAEGGGVRRCVRCNLIEPRYSIGLKTSRYFTRPSTNVAS